MKIDDLVSIAVGQLAASVRDHARVDIRATLEDDLDCMVRELPANGPQRPGHGSCDGISYLTDQTVVLFRATPSRRQNFTLAHELGHLLVRDCDFLQDWLADHPQPRLAEEWICDGIAQSLLLPPDCVSRIERPLTARSVVALFNASEASLAACCVAATRLLAGPAGIVLFDAANGRVELAVVQPDGMYGFPASFPWRGQAIPEGHPLQQLRASATASHRGRMNWSTPWGAQASYYVDALRHRGQILAIFSDQDIWQSERLHLDTAREFLPARQRVITCCGQTCNVASYPCPDCGTPYCPRCGDCQCDKRAATEVTCTRCFLRKQAHLVVDGICSDCC